MINDTVLPLHLDLLFRHNPGHCLPCKSPPNLPQGNIDLTTSDSGPAPCGLEYHKDGDEEAQVQEQSPNHNQNRRAFVSLGDKPRKGPEIAL